MRGRGACSVRCDGVDAALAMARARRNRWFDPRLVDRVLAWRGDSAWWAQLLELKKAEHVPRKTQDDDWETAT